VRCKSWRSRKGYIPKPPPRIAFIVVVVCYCYLPVEVCYRLYTGLSMDVPRSIVVDFIWLRSADHGAALC